MDLSNHFAVLESRSTCYTRTSLLDLVTVHYNLFIVVSVSYVYQKGKEMIFKIIFQIITKIGKWYF